MALPTSINYIPQYEAVLPPRVQWDVDDCTNCAVLTAMELRGILMGQPVKQLSQLFLDWQQNSYGGVIPPPYIPSNGGTSYGAARWAQQIGVCREYLWPISMIGANDYDQMRATVNLQPSAACYQDAPNHVLTDWIQFPYYADQATMIANIQTNLAAGYPITATDATAFSHEYALCGYDMIAGGCFVLDSHAWPQETFMPWSRLAPRVIVRNVQFTVPKQVAITAAQIQSLQQLTAQFPTIVGSA
jgi:hypothetical protein